MKTLINWVIFLHKKGFFPRGHTRLIAWLAQFSSSAQETSVELPIIGDFSVDLSDRGQIGYYLSKGLPSEQADILILSKLVKGFETIFDVGAHIGYYSRLSIAFSNCVSVHAFEPSEATFKGLEKNLKGFDQAVLNNKAVTASSMKEQAFFVNPSSDLSSLVKPSGKRIKVDTVSLDDYCKNKLIERVDFIKCDVEGVEEEVLQGATGLLNSVMPPIWLLENTSLAAQLKERSEEMLVEVFKRQSSQSISVFIACVKDETVGIEDYEPINSLGKSAKCNIWIVPECRKDIFLQAVSELNKEPDSLKKINSI